jgi:hypothetical protein
MTVNNPDAYLCENADGSVRYVALTRDESSVNWTQTPLFRRGQPLSTDQIYEWCKGDLTLLQICRIIEAAHGIR